MDEQWKTYVRAMSHYNTDEWRMVQVARMTGVREYIHKADVARWRRCIACGIAAAELVEIGIEKPEGVENEQ